MWFVYIFYFGSLFLSALMYTTNKAKSQEKGDSASESAQVAGFIFLMLLSPFILGLIGSIVFNNFINQKS